MREAAKALTTTEVKEKLQERQEYLWTTDRISNTPLRDHIVSDCLGRLYNKETILYYLLKDPAYEKQNEQAEEILNGYVIKTKDLVDVQFETDPEAKKNGKLKKNVDMNGDAGGKIVTNWICPVSRKPLGPGSKAVYLVPCGHAFASIALKEVKTEACLQCGKSYQANDVIPIVPATEDELAKLKARIKLYKEHGLYHSSAAKKLDKKDKKSEKDEQGKKRKRDVKADDRVTEDRKENKKRHVTVNGTAE